MRARGVWRRVFLRCLCGVSPQLLRGASRFGAPTAVFSGVLGLTALVTGVTLGTGTGCAAPGGVRGCAGPGVCGAGDTECAGPGAFCGRDGALRRRGRLRRGRWWGREVATETRGDVGDGDGGGNGALRGVAGWRGRGPFAADTGNTDGTHTQLAYLTSTHYNTHMPHNHASHRHKQHPHHAASPRGPTHLTLTPQQHTTACPNLGQTR